MTLVVGKGGGSGGRGERTQHISLSTLPFVFALRAVVQQNDTCYVHDMSRQVGNMVV